MTAAAKLVVSDKGDNLSPKYAPEIIAPAVIASEHRELWRYLSGQFLAYPATVHELQYSAQEMRRQDRR